VRWFDDGSVIVRAPDGQTNTVLFRIHERLLCRHSKRVLERQVEDGWDVPTLTIPSALGVHVTDFIALLAFLYHDAPLSVGAPFAHVAALLRVSASAQLDIPSVHALARACLESMFSSGPIPFVHPVHDLEEALYLAVRFKVASIQKGIYYSLVTMTDFEAGTDATQGTTALTPADVERCQNLMTRIVEHFTPVLFEPPVTPHMACTNLLADKWFPLVTQSAIAGDSVYRPLEALEQLKQIDWKAEGLCAACVREKREEWTHEQEEVWDKMDEWLASE